MNNVLQITLSNQTSGQELTTTFVNRAVDFSLSSDNHERGVSLITHHLARVFEVQPDEISLLVLDQKGQNLHYVAPSFLSELHASIPFNRIDSLAGRALLDGKPLVEHGKKILSYPLFVGHSPLGVVQVTRKRFLFQFTHRGFTSDKIEIVKMIEPSLSKLLQGIRSTRFSQHPESLVGSK